MEQSTPSPRRWGSFTDMPPDTARQASAILRRRTIPRNVTVILPYISTGTGERRVWRFSGGPLPKRCPVAVRLSDGAEFTFTPTPGGAA